jgi:hypothetical protein
MYCSQCNAQVSEDDAFCASCGGPVAAPRPFATAEPAGGRPPGSHAGGGLQQYNFDVRRWTRNDRVVGAGTLIALVALFLPWFSVNLAGLGSLGVSSSGTATESGTDAHGWLWFVFIIGLVVLFYLLVTAGYQSLPARLPLKHEQLLAALTAINFFLILLAFLLKPSSDGQPVKIGWTFGAIVALIAAIVAVLPEARSALSERNASRAS